MHFIFPGLYDYDVMSFVVHFLRREDLFVDVGANIGAYTLLASGVSGARSVSFEPGSLAFSYLIQNVRLNDLTDKVTCVNAALGWSEGTIRMTEGLGTENHVCSGSEGQGSVEVPLKTLDGELKGLEPVLIKVDVEGFETEVFAGATQTLKKSSLAALIVERAGNAERYNRDERDLHDLIQSMSFTPCSYSPADRSLNRDGLVADGDVIYVRDFETAQQKLREAQSFHFAGLTI